MLWSGIYKIGDILPESDRARLFIIFYGIIGTGMTANALTKFSVGKPVSL